MSLLTVSALRVRYGAVHAVRGLSLRVERGEIVALLGANGAGKSSTLNAIAGLVALDAGTVAFDGADIGALAAEAKPGIGLALAPEGRRVFATLSVEDNLKMGAYTVADVRRRAAAYERVYALFPVLAERRAQFAGTLSGGQQQMLAIGRALMCEPRLLLLDEPSLGLAPRVVEQVFALIEALREQGVTICLVEQNVAAALAIADRAYLLGNGSLIREGSAAAMRERAGVAGELLGAHREASRNVEQ